MFRTSLLKLFSILVLQIVLTQSHFGQVSEKLQPNDRELNPQWLGTYLETLKNLDFPKHVTVSDLRSLEKLLMHLSKDQSQVLMKNIDLFLKALIHNSFNFQNALKSARESRNIILNNEDEGSGSPEETFEDYVSKSDVLYQLFNDLFLLKKKVIDVSERLPLIISMMNENEEMNEQNPKLTTATKVLQERTSLLSKKLQWIKEKAQNITGLLSQIPFLDYIRNLKDYLGQQSSIPAEMDELESEIEDLLKEFEETEEFFVAEWEELDEVDTENLSEIENEHSEDMSQEQTTQSIPEELPEIQETTTTTEINRKARKLFDIKTEKKEKNKDGEFVKVWRKTIKIFKDEDKNKSKETSSKDEKWKEEVYNKIFKDDKGQNKLVADQTHEIMKETQTQTENLGSTSETMQENIFEKIFGNKEEIKMIENKKEKERKIKKTKNFSGGDSSTEKNKHEKLVDDNRKKNLQDKVKHIHKENESEDNSWKKNFYDTIRSKTEIVGNKTSNITNYIESITNGFYTTGNESQLRKIIEGIRASKNDITKTIREKFNNVTNTIQNSLQVAQPNESEKISQDKEKWSLGNLKGSLINAKENITKRIKTFDNVKPNFNSLKTDTSMEDSKVLKKSKLDSLSMPAEEGKHVESPSFVTVTSTYYTVLLTTTTQNVIYEKTVTYTSTEVLETRLSPTTTTHTKNLQLKTKAADQPHTHKFSSIKKEKTEIESESFKNELLDKLKNIL